MLEIIRYILDNPHLSIREVGRQFDTCESTIRAWKKTKRWEEETQRLAEQRREAELQFQKEEQERYKDELRQEIADLKRLRDAAKTNAALFFQMSNKALKELATEKDAVKACGKALKFGINKHSDSAMKGAEAVAKLDERIYQIDILLDHFEKEKAEKNALIS